jgi:hypothetical protein
MRTTLLLLLLPFLSAAQTFNLNDPDIVWAIAITQDWKIDNPSYESEDKDGVTTLKILRTKPYQTPYLANYVFQAAVEGDLPIFKDSSCLIPTDISEAFPGKDTLLTFDPETFEETIQIVYVEPFLPYDFKCWRLHQILSYQKSSGNWRTQVVSLAPMVEVHNLQGDSIGIRPLFWFKADNNCPDLLNNDITWAKLTENKPENTRVRSSPNAKVLKATKGFENPLKHQERLLIQDANTVFYDFLNEKPLNMADRAELLTSTDTVAIFNPETYEEYQKIIRKDIKMDSIRDLRLLQAWSWNDRLNRLSICLDAVAPLEDVLDEEGKLRFKRPLFYRRAQEK